MEKKIELIKKLTDTKYLNLFYYKYNINGKESNYYVASRRKEEDLAIKNVGKVIADAVRILPYFYKDGEIFVVLTREFRQPINDYVYSTPAGRIEDGDTAEETVVREVQEEIGAKVLNMHLMATPAYSSVGLTDEAIACYSVEIEYGGKANLQDCEIIESFVMPLKDISRFADEKVHDFQAKMVIKLFYYEKMEELRKLKKELDDLSK